jgi:hypothetical protein
MIWDVIGSSRGKGFVAEAACNGFYEVVKQLPDSSEPEYRIKSISPLPFRNRKTSRIPLQRWRL